MIQVKSAAYRSPKHTSRWSKVERSTLWVCVHSLSDELSILYFVSLHCGIDKTEHYQSRDMSTAVSSLLIQWNYNDYLHDPEIRICSLRTITIFFPCSSCLATIEARRPRRWPLPSTTTTSAMILHCWRYVNNEARRHIRELAQPA